MGGYVDHTFPMVIQFATPSAVMTSSKNIFVVDEKIPVTPIKLVFPFNGVNRTDMFQWLLYYDNHFLDDILFSLNTR